MLQKHMCNNKSHQTGCMPRRLLCARLCHVSRVDVDGHSLLMVPDIVSDTDGAEAPIAGDRVLIAGGRA
jgi:hypothetical protein